MSKRIKYIAAGKAARFMGVSVGYLHKLCRDKKIHHARVGELKRDAMGRDMRPVVFAEFEIDNLMEIIPVKRDWD